MKRFYFSGLLIALTVFSVKAQRQYQYPKAPIEETVDTYFGDSIADPYQWMENPEDLRLQTWLKSQSGLIKKEERHQKYEDILQKQIASMYLDVKEYTSKKASVFTEKNTKKYLFKNEYSRIDRSAVFLKQC